jgi:hypothetical protein
MLRLRSSPGLLQECMPPTAFPELQFQSFGIGASAFFPKLLSDEDLNDPLERRRHFERAWQAVRYRYRLCAECNDEFKALLTNASELWRAGLSDEEQNYKLERCIYVFFMSGLSVLESFSFCLYFLGNILQPNEFPHVGKPRGITLAATAKGFTTAFPQAAITRHLSELLQKPEFTTIDEIRNILAHRLSGRRSIQSWGTTHPDGTHTHTQEETWYLPGSDEKLIFDEELIQRHLDEIACLLTTLALAALKFISSIKSPKQK